jgi:hypothetical protein
MLARLPEEVPVQKDRRAAHGIHITSCGSGKVACWISALKSAATARSNFRAARRALNAQWSKRI